DMHDAREIEMAGIVFVEGTIQGRQAVLCKCGVGKVNAAVCTQLLIDRFRVDAIIFTGVAGALDPSFSLGDIVISKECMQHDMDVSALGDGRGMIPYQDVSIFPADERLVAAALSAGSQCEGKAVTGRVLSGDQFIANRDTVRLLHEELQGACTEMEGA